MKFFIASVVGVFIAGCAHSPSHVIHSGKFVTGIINKSPANAAQCIRNNAEWLNELISVTESEIANNEYELILRNKYESNNVISVWRFTRTSSGTIYRVWFTPHLIQRIEALVADMRGEC